jgi:hypothetical protein
MKKHITIVLFSVVAIFTSCEPRVELDLTQWGDQAFIIDADIFSQEVRTDFKLAEFYLDGTESTGVRRNLLNTGSIDINDDTFTVTFTVPAGTDLSNTGLLIAHKSTKVEPLNGSPIPGTISDLSAGSFSYRLHSADGTTHDWKISITN